MFQDHILLSSIWFFVVVAKNIVFEGCFFALAISRTDINYCMVRVPTIVSMIVSGYSKCNMHVLKKFIGDDDNYVYAKISNK